MDRIADIVVDSTQQQVWNTIYYNVLKAAYQSNYDDQVIRRISINMRVQQLDNFIDIYNDYWR